MWLLNVLAKPKSTVHTLQFHMSSAKAFEEVGKVIRTVIKPEPVNQSNTDKKFGFLLMNPRGEVVVLTNKLLQLCPGVPAKAKTPKLDDSKPGAAPKTELKEQSADPKSKSKSKSKPKSKPVPCFKLKNRGGV